MYIIKKWSFWLFIFSVSVCLFNALGFDDKNLLLFFTSPPMMLVENLSTFLRRFLPEGEPLFAFYAMTILFWFLIGLSIDWMINLVHRRRLLKMLPWMCLALFLFVGIITSFYMYQHSEYVVGRILNHYEDYDKDNVRFAVIQVADNHWGQEYIDELERIVKTTKDRDIYGTTIVALGRIGTPQSISIIMADYGRFGNSHIYRAALQRNKKTIMTMLDTEMPKVIIHSGLTAAQVLRYEAFIEPLQHLADQHLDRQVRQIAEEVLHMIKKDPRTSNPKWDVD